LFYGTFLPMTKTLQWWRHINETICRLQTLDEDNKFYVHLRYSFWFWGKRLLGGTIFWIYVGLIVNLIPHNNVKAVWSEHKVIYPITIYGKVTYIHFWSYLRTYIQFLQGYTILSQVCKWIYDSKSDLQMDIRYSIRPANGFTLLSHNNFGFMLLCNTNSKHYQFSFVWSWLYC
jgi:hypothetical protein